MSERSASERWGLILIGRAPHRRAPPPGTPGQYCKPRVRRVPSEPHPQPPTSRAAPPPCARAPA
eukprot:3613104-Prymnesium_polylepis.2